MNTQEKDKKIEEQYAKAQVKWLEDHGFSAEGRTFVVTGESYSIKDELKAVGFRYDPVLKWHKAEPVEEYASRLVEVQFDQVCDMAPWGEGHFKAEASAFISKLTQQEEEINTISQWIGLPGDIVKDRVVQLIKKRSYNGRYGMSNVITFQDKDKNLFTWFTSTNPAFVVGDELKIVSARIKDHNEYRGERSTVITRPKLEPLPAE